jgi:hypothetical protein
LIYLILLRPPLALRKHNFLRHPDRTTGSLVAFRRGLKEASYVEGQNALGITVPISLLAQTDEAIE